MEILLGVVSECRSVNPGRLKFLVVGFSSMRVDEENEGGIWSGRGVSDRSWGNVERFFGARLGLRTGFCVSEVGKDVGCGREMSCQRLGRRVSIGYGNGLNDEMFLSLFLSFFGGWPMCFLGACKVNQP